MEATISDSFTVKTNSTLRPARRRYGAGLAGHRCERRIVGACPVAGCRADTGGVAAVNDEFEAHLAEIYAALAKDQEPLGAEFEAVWDANVDDLYEP